MKFHIISVVWGRAYVDFFLLVTLPNQLSTGNLAAFTAGNTTYKIYTDEQDAIVIRASEAFRRLSSLLKTEIIIIDHLQHDYKYTRMTLCHKLAIHDAYHDNARVVLLPPDVIYAENSFAHLFNVAQSGKPVVLMAAPRVQRESFIPAAVEMFCDQPTGTISGSSRGLMQLVMSHFHPVSVSNFYNTPDANLWPSQLYFDVPGSGFIAHCFHLHPLMFIPRSPNTTFEGTVDADYLLNAYQDVSDIHILDDSDQFLAVEPCDTSYKSARSSSGYEFFRLIEWIQRNTDSHHRKFVTHPIMFHYTDVSLEWDRVEETATMALSMMMKYVH